MRRLPTLLLIATIVSSCGVSTEQVATFTPAPLFVDNHVSGAHGPLSAAGTQADWGVVRLWTSSFGEDWLGNIDGDYIAHPTNYSAGYPWAAVSAHFTTAVAHEFEGPPGVFSGRSNTIGTTFAQLPYLPAAVTVQYDDPCPLAMATQWTVAHACTGDWTPMDSAGLPTFVIGNGIVKPGLPFGDYLKYTAPGGYGSWCAFNFSDLPNVTKPAGAPARAVAINACP
jgi:hypothetical protein